MLLPNLCLSKSIKLLCFHHSASCKDPILLLESWEHYWPYWPWWTWPGVPHPESCAPFCLGHDLSQPHKCFLCSALSLDIALWGTCLLDRPLSPILSPSLSPVACYGSPWLAPSLGSLFPKSPGAVSGSCHWMLSWPTSLRACGSVRENATATSCWHWHQKKWYLQKDTSSKSCIFSNIFYHSIHNYSFQHLLTTIRFPWY